MINSLTFKTRARTLDHLGREQIADVPTAISELWKNAYDAYSTGVNVTLYDGEKPVVAIADDGHGMNYDEFVEKWLVVGTESKMHSSETPIADRFGLPRRSKQGQKGIGRLSSAHLGPIMLLISKRQNDEFVIAMIDWRLFENPYLLLSDIQIPVTTVANKGLLFEEVPLLVESLMENVWGTSGDDARNARIQNAWTEFDKGAHEDWLSFNDKMDLFDNKKWLAPSERIAQSIVDAGFEERHADAWPLWNNQSDHGTIMLVSEINEDFHVYLQDGNTSSTQGYIKDRFFQTLAAFVDPYFDKGDSPLISKEVNAVNVDFSPSMDIVEANRRRAEVDEKTPFDRKIINELEHVFYGTIDEHGVFSGCVKVFGKWRVGDYTYKIFPPKDLHIPKRSDSKLGPCDIYIGTYDRVLNSSTLSDEQFAFFEELALRYSGFYIYRDGLRVLPYGREDNDFFEIEQRRSLNAGREFWNKRRMFGRLGLSRSLNPNLKDKAGREGFIDNTSAKTLKKLVENILMTAARDYFGSASEIRTSELKTIQNENLEKKAKEKAELDAEKLKAKQKKEFGKNLDAANKLLPQLIEEIRQHLKQAKASASSDIQSAQEKLENARRTIARIKIRSGIPAKTTRKEDRDYQAYQHSIAEATGLAERLSVRISEWIERDAPAKPAELLDKQIKRLKTQSSRNFGIWKQKVDTLLDGERARISKIRAERATEFDKQADLLLHLVQEGRETLAVATKKLEVWHAEFMQEDTEIFESYISSLDALKESIDLENVALHGVAESEDLRAEVERLNELAQLGVAVEILGHELHAYDNMMSRGLANLPEEVRKSQAADSIRNGYEGVSKQLNFLAPLKVSGQRTFRNISGEELFDYLRNFFEELLRKRHIKFSASETFKNIKVYDQPARLFPVFINLVNNSQYWLFVTEKENKEIRLDLIDGKAIVSDNGPGIEAHDVKRLFQLFFTRKSRGGRGVGLYLCRANLRAGGHSIDYVADATSMPLDGANFAVTFSNFENM
ncbi:ATP-binding protein [Coralliovum pocilloporae]|uniref:ATP-binding protein n=1 Tax=Coralliovum pocilloporae TaxID=3066369 RepID=UPI00330714F8